MSTDTMQSIFDHFELEPQFFLWQIEGNGDDLEAFIKSYVKTNLFGDQECEKIIALATSQGFKYEEAETLIDDDEWLVLTADETDRCVIEEAEYYFNDIVLPEVPEFIHPYIDENAWIDDFCTGDTGEILNRYDGMEYIEEINGTTYYIYQQ